MEKIQVSKILFNRLQRIGTKKITMCEKKIIQRLFGPPDFVCCLIDRKPSSCEKFKFSSYNIVENLVRTYLSLKYITSSSGVKKGSLGL